MIRHELRYLFLHWRWMILLWWAIVFIDLGYQCEWWWSEPGLSEFAAWDTRDEIHETMRQFVMLVLWIGLSSAALGAFLGISPARSHASIQTRPIRRKELILSRVLWVCLFFGTPLWLHEFIYLRTQTELPLSFCLGGVLQRLIHTFLLWLVFASVGLVSRSFWSAVNRHPGSGRPAASAVCIFQCRSRSGIGFGASAGDSLFYQSGAIQGCLANGSQDQGFKNLDLEGFEG